MVFRLSGKHLLITWPQCPVPQEVMSDKIVDILSDNDSFRLSTELHDDGNQHYHCFIRAATKFNIRNNRHFDVDYNGTVYHPNCQVAKKPIDAFNYVSKDGDYFDHGDPRPAQHKSDPWTDVLGAETKEAFLDTVADIAPRDFVLYHDKIQSFADSRYKRVLPPYDSPFQDFAVPAPIQRWVDENIQVNHTPKKKSPR